MLQKQHSSILETLPSYGTLSVSDAEKLVHAFMTSRLDYCNALLGGCPAASINKLQILRQESLPGQENRSYYSNFTVSALATY